VLGEEHKETAKAYGNLASIYRKNGDLEKALEYQLKALKGAKAGGNKKQILKNLENLKRIYIGLKNWKKVKEIEKEIRKLEGKRKRF
jgi:tetratricopeptide (TPR) repeat protein